MRVAALSFTANADPATNAGVMLRAIDEAADAGARILATPECASIGYPPAARDDFAGLDVCGLGDWEDRLLIHAERRGIVLVLGSVGMHPGGAQDGSSQENPVVCGVGGGPLPPLANEAVVGGAVKPVRYRKRCLTGSDERYFEPGHRSAWFDLDGVRIGLAICFDLRFPDIYADLAEAGCQAVIHIAHMAGPDPDPGTKPHVIPAFVSVRAAEYTMPILFCNTAAEDRWLDSGLWDGRGMPVASQGEGLLITDLTPGSEFGGWYQDLRARSLARLRT